MHLFRASTYIFRTGQNDKCGKKKKKEIKALFHPSWRCLWCFFTCFLFFLPFPSLSAEKGFTMFASFESYRSGLALSYWATQGCFRAALWISLLLQISIWESAKINASLSSVDSLLPNASWHILFLLLYSGGDLEGGWFPPPMSSHQRLPGCRCEEPSTSATTSTSADHWWSWGVCGVSFKQWGILSWAQRVAAKIREQLMVPLATAAGFLWEAPREGRDTTSVAITAPLSSEKCWQRPGHRMSLPSVHLRQMLWLFPAAFLCHITPFEATKLCSDPSVEDGVQGTGIVYPLQRWLPLCILCLWVPVLQWCR